MGEQAEVNAERSRRTSSTTTCGHAAKAVISRRRLLTTGAITLLGIITTGTARPSTGRPTPGTGADPRISTRSAPAHAAGTSPIEIGASPSLQRRAAAPKYYIDDAGPMAIALTLDDGPDPIYTPQVLDILDQYGIRATFNMIGEQIGENLPLVREVAAAGHTITNHTWDHADLDTCSTARVISEIDRCNDALSEAGQFPSIFRAPYGNWTPAVFEACAMRNLIPLDWSVDPQDWDTTHVTTRDIVRTVLRTTRPHDIILEHDGGGDRSNTVAALRIFIPSLLERGFIFATL